MLFLSVSVAILTNTWNVPFVNNISLPSSLGKITTIYPDFNPSFHVNDDGKPFLITSNLDNWEFLSLSLNSLLSLKRVGVTNVTTFSHKKDLAKLLTQLGYYVYDDSDERNIGGANPLLTSHPLPHWSWGDLLLRRVRIMIAAIQRGINYCLVDLDVVYATNALFASTSDILAQGLIKGDYGNVKPNAQKCGFAWTVPKTLYAPETYINNGVMCFSVSKGIVELYKNYVNSINLGVSKSVMGYAQPALVREICRGELHITKSSDKFIDHVEYGFLQKRNVTIQILTTDHVPNANNIHLYHPKGCHADHKTKSRVKCKVEALKKVKKWYIPKKIEVLLEANPPNESSIASIVKWFRSQH